MRTDAFALSDEHGAAAVTTHTLGGADIMMYAAGPRVPKLADLFHEVHAHLMESKWEELTEDHSDVFDAFAQAVAGPARRLNPCWSSSITNSWGSEWGPDGYLYTAYKAFPGLREMASQSDEAAVEATDAFLRMQMLSGGVPKWTSNQNVAPVSLPVSSE